MNAIHLASEVTHDVRTKLDNLVVQMEKNQRIFVRVTAAQKAIIEAAAEVTKTSVSEFMLESAVRDARDAIQDKTVFVVTPEIFAQMEERLAAPPTPNPGLEELFRRAQAWREANAAK
jgi:uncharacterized protein (DUF1778 family)